MRAIQGSVYYLFLIVANRTRKKRFPDYGTYVGSQGISVVFGQQWAGDAALFSFETRLTKNMSPRIRFPSQIALASSPDVSVIVQLSP